MIQHLTKLVVLLTVLLVSGCSIPTPSHQDSNRQVNIDLVNNHQNKLNAFNNWSMSGRMALIQKELDERDSFYVNWRYQPTYQELRFSHPLKGQLAKLTVSERQATLVDSNGATRSALTAPVLLADVLQVYIPFEQLHQWLIGQRTARLNNLTYYNNGTLASASVIQNNQQWRIRWFYDSQTDTELPLPEQLHIDSPTLKIKVQMQEWQTHN
ncbi:outer membrane lipoprotein LolB [Idiomarina sp. X4]|uniref:lipoprotein insertase outer membrane protein LolB n=1 Tax=Idiomarina sp. X4 TaxID=2055892 RepID=UPI000C28E62B|nr:lipoprotein insertase outer membrane protein LolB [Idiomarina sp. X4]ATZ72338.1 outer membrane lipoprotein LolB [Idiomarina sp. X4]